MKIHSTCNCFSTYTCFRNFHSGPGLGQSCKFSCGHNLFVSQEHFFWYSFVQKEASLYIWSIDAINANQGEIRGGNWVSHKHPPDPS